MKDATPLFHSVAQTSRAHAHLERQKSVLHCLHTDNTEKTTQLHHIWHSLTL